MDKFSNPVVKFDGEEFQLRCTGAALARIEDVYEGAPFTEAIASLVTELESRKFRIGKLAKVFCALVVADDSRKPSKPTEDWVLERISDTKKTVEVVEAISNAIVAHFPTGQNEGTGDDGATDDPTNAAKA